MKRGLAALVGLAFLFASAGLVGATGQTAPKADDSKKAPDTKPADTKMDKSAAPAKKQHTAVGTVKSAGADGLVIVSKVKGKDVEKTFAMDDKVKIKKAGKDITVKDLAPGDKVTVRHTDEGGKMTAVNVSVAAGQAAKAEAPPTSPKK